MNIYIYGSNSFKKKILAVLSKNKIDSIELNTIESLEEAILFNPKDIFLIDNEKIIVNNFFTNNFRFLNPKDGIAQDYLIENGIGNININSIDDLPSYLLPQLQIKNTEETTNEIEEINENYDNINSTINTGDIMEQLTQLEDINEADMIEALSGIEGINVKNGNNTINISSSDATTSTQTNKIEVDSTNLDDIASLLEQLKNNKTLEISIRVKG